MALRVAIISPLVCGAALATAWAQVELGPPALEKGYLTPAQLQGLAGTLPTFDSSLFTGSGNCAACHTSDGTALRDSMNNDVSPPTDWRSTMMANAFRDPLFQAKLESEVLRNPHLQELIEDDCLTCHAPLARTQVIQDGAARITLAQARSMEMASDGVSCTLCHQVQPRNLGSPESYSGHYIIDPVREIYGPYEDVLVQPMQFSVNYTPLFGEHMLTSEHCATCHTLFTPYVDDMGAIAGEFPEQVPYLEWLNSVYAGGPEARSCQECHMPVLEEPIVIATIPVGLEGLEPFFQHHFVGGNAFMLSILRDNRVLLGATATEAQFNTTIARTLEQLTTRTASLEIAAEALSGLVRAEVTVTNHTGHKFPTGYPARRAWLRLTVRDGLGAVRFDSGAWDAAGEIAGLDLPFEPHHTLITLPSQVQVYEAIAADVNGAPTMTLLRMASLLKDNRLPPRGFLSTGPETQHTAIAGGAADDPDFNRDGAVEGTGSDTVAYEIMVGDVPQPLTVEATLLYQSVPPGFVAELLTDSTPAVQRFALMYGAADNTPIALEQRQVMVTDPSPGLPATLLLR